jgi:hypothetical protein
MLVLATAVANAFIDNYLIKKKWGKVKNLNHTSRTVIRFCIFTLGGYFLYGEEVHVQEYMWQMLLEFFKPFLIVLYSFFLFNIVFDLLLNKLRSLPWYYDGKDAYFDQLSSHYNRTLSKESHTTELVAYIELGAKLIITLILAVWILSI